MKTLHIKKSKLCEKNWNFSKKHIYYLECTVHAIRTKMHRIDEPNKEKCL